MQSNCIVFTLALFKKTIDPDHDQENCSKRDSDLFMLIDTCLQ